MNTNTATPSLFCTLPMSSILKKSEAETVARNIMAILKRTGDTFRNLDWEEYKEERQKDGQFTEGEYHYFMQVIEYCLNAETAKLFSPVWKQAYNKFREENPNNTDNTPASKNGSKEIKLINYLFNPAAVTIDGEDSMLFEVYSNLDYKRTKKDAQQLGKEIVSRFNSHALLLEALKGIVKDLIPLYPEQLILFETAKSAIAAAEKAD